MALATSTATRDRFAFSRGSSCDREHSPCAGRRRQVSRPEQSSVHDSRHRDSAHGGCGEAGERCRLLWTDSCVWPAAGDSARDWPDRRVKTVPSYRTRRAFRIEILNLSTWILLQASHTAGFLPTPPILTATAVHSESSTFLFENRITCVRGAPLGLLSGPFADPTSLRIQYGPEERLG